MFCAECLQALAGRLPGRDYGVLACLSDLGATDGPHARRIEDILAEAQIKSSTHDVRMSLTRLTASGFVEGEPDGRAIGYWVTEDGLRALEWFIETSNASGSGK